MDERALQDLRDLAARDDELSHEAERMRGLDAQVGALRARAEAIDAFFAGFEQEKRRRHELVSSARAELADRRAELADAEAQLARARDDDTRARVRSVVARARDHVAVAEAAVDRADGAAAELERDAASLPEEVPVLEERARSLAEEVPHVPPPAAGARDLVEWASQAHAELFVAAGQLDAQRERGIREANELATMLLGEPTYGSTVEQLAERLLPLAGK